MKDKEIYISFNREEYKKNKSNILNSQVDLLNIAQALQRLKKLRREESILKIQLSRMFSDVLENLDKIEEKIPTPDIPKSVKKELGAEEEFGVGAEEEFNEGVDEEKDRSIEEELINIQEKLRELNNTKF